MPSSIILERSSTFASLPQFRLSNSNISLCMWLNFCQACFCHIITLPSFCGLGVFSCLCQSIVSILALFFFIPSNRSTMGTTTTRSFSCGFNHCGRESEKASVVGQAMILVAAAVVLTWFQPTQQYARLRRMRTWLCALNIALTTMVTIIMLRSS